MGCGTSQHEDVKTLVCFMSLRSLDMRESETEMSRSLSKSLNRAVLLY